MVGFGSTFRMSRRRGWEAAYCDYETLKLLLTHIEAVYEEHENDRSNDILHGYHDDFYYFGLNGFGTEDAFGREGNGEGRDLECDGEDGYHDSGLDNINSNRRKRRARQRRDKQKQKKNQPRNTDWRDELFAETDSSAAFASSEYEYETSSSDEGGMLGGGRGYVPNNTMLDEHGRQIHGPGQMDNMNSISIKSTHRDSTTNLHDDYDAHDQSLDFPSMDSANFNYSYEHGYGRVSYGSNSGSLGMLGSNSGSLGANSTSANSSGAIINIGSGKSSASGALAGTGTNSNSVSGAASFGSVNEEHSNFLTNTFASQVQPIASRSRTGSLESNEEGSKESILVEGSRHMNANVDTMRIDVLANSHLQLQQPASSKFNQKHSHQEQAQQQQHFSGAQAFGTTQTRNVLGVGSVGGSKYNSLNSHQFPRHKPRKRRKRHRSSYVPPHLRKAHVKARAITGRFLGLLRAEVDKISLFTHSRMGELTDTIGSLRFPSDDNCMHGGGDVDGHGYGYSGDYGSGTAGVYSDGGLHPSGSSSSEDISISSDDEDGRGNLNSLSENYGSINSASNKIRNRPRSDSGRLDFQHMDDIQNNQNQNENEWMKGLGLVLDEDFLKSTTFRQLRLGEELRLTRPIFQRSDQVLGEDFLLLSAVDEADAFTAVGVEFIHLLRYIFVNAIAIRKLCKKHDHLLGSRMLGGYYHKLRKQKDQDMNFDDDLSDSGACSRVRRRRRKCKRQNQTTPKRKNPTPRQKIEPLNQPSPTLRYSSMHQNQTRGKYNLVGVYDSHVQKLSNSLIASTLSDSLCLALSEFEVSRRRADRLSSFRPNIQKKRVSNESSEDLVSMEADDLCHSFPSPKTFGFESSKKSHEDFREDGEASGDERSDAASTYSNSVNSLTRLRFVVTSAITLRNAAVENQNIFGDFLSRSTLTADGGEFVGTPFGLNGCSRETLQFFVSYNPDYALILDCHVLQNALCNQDHALSLSHLLQVPCATIKDEAGTMGMEISVHSTTESIVSGGVPLPTCGIKYPTSQSYQRMFQLNLVSVVLSTINYYIALPSAASFCHSLGWKYAHSALLIGSSNVTALLTLLYHVYRFHSPSNLSFKKMLIVSALCPLVGNILYAKGYEHKSFAMAIFGRLLIGFSSADMINKELIVAFRLKRHLVSELTKIRVAQFGSVYVALLFGTIHFTETILVFRGESFIFNFITISGYIMALAWFLQLFSLAFCSFPKMLQLPERTLSDKSGEICMSASEHEDLRQYRLEKDYLLPGLLARVGSLSDAEVPKRRKSKLKENPSFSAQIKGIMVPIKKARKLVLHNIALPIALLVFGFVSLSIEICFTSCVLITNRYFKWEGVRAGHFLTFLAVWILPAYFLMSYAITRYGERLIMKKALVAMAVSLLFFINYEALYVLIKDVRAIFQQERADEPLTTYYDWNVGLIQYCCSVTMIFLMSVVVEGASLSLISKVSPQKLNRSTVNCSVIVPFIFYFSRILGDAIIVVVGFSHRQINTDLVNSISFVLMILCYCSYHVVKKHYFFLNGS